MISVRRLFVVICAVGRRTQCKLNLPTVRHPSSFHALATTTWYSGLPHGLHPLSKRADSSSAHVPELITHSVISGYAVPTAPHRLTTHTLTAGTGRKYAPLRGLRSASPPTPFPAHCSFPVPSVRAALFVWPFRCAAPVLTSSPTVRSHRRDRRRGEDTTDFRSDGARLVSPAFVGGKHQRCGRRSEPPMRCARAAPLPRPSSARPPPRDPHAIYAMARWQ